MKRLILIRHAKSDWNDASLSDFDRPLNSRGKKAAPLMGKRIAQRDLTPELLISSPAQRARSTAELIAQGLEMHATDIRFQPEIYDASSETLIELLRAFPETNHIALIGHNPGLSDLASWLCPDAPAHLPTCAVLVLEMDIATWDRTQQGCARILVYDYPKKLS